MIPGLTPSQTGSLSVTSESEDEQPLVPLQQPIDGSVVNSWWHAAPTLALPTPIRPWMLPRAPTPPPAPEQLQLPSMCDMAPPEIDYASYAQPAEPELALSLQTRRSREQARYELRRLPLADSEPGRELLTLSTHVWYMLPNLVCIMFLSPDAPAHKVSELAKYINWLGLLCRGHKSVRNRLLGVSDFYVFNQALQQNGSAPITPLFREFPPDLPLDHRPAFARPGFSDGSTRIFHRRRGD